MYEDPKYGLGAVVTTPSSTVKEQVTVAEHLLRPVAAAVKVTGKGFSPPEISGSVRFVPQVLKPLPTP
jgi:hypothetical protein